MTESEMARVERCGQLCEWSLQVEAECLVNGDLDGAAEAADAAGCYAETAFAIAVPTGDHWL